VSSTGWEGCGVSMSHRYLLYSYLCDTCVQKISYIIMQGLFQDFAQEGANT
jgi:hypothetical protein